MAHPDDIIYSQGNEHDSKTEPSVGYRSNHDEPAPHTDLHDPRLHEWLQGGWCTVVNSWSPCARGVPGKRTLRRGAGTTSQKIGFVFLEGAGTGLA
jgi:hypothetical protein